MKNNIITSAITIMCVLCGGWISGAFAAPSVRALGGAGTYTGTTSAAAARTGGTTATTSARAGSVRVTPSVKVSTSTTPRVSNSGTSVSTSDDQRMSIGKYLGPSVTGGAKVSNGTGTAASYTDADFDALAETVDDLVDQVDSLVPQVSSLVDQIGSFIGEDYLTKTDAADTYLTAESLSSLGYATSDALSELSSQVANNKSALEKLNGDKDQDGSVRQIASNEADAAVAAAAQYTDKAIKAATAGTAMPTEKLPEGRYYVWDTTGEKPQWRDIGVQNDWSSGT